MLEYQLKDKCHVNTNWDHDTFVGIKCENGDFSVNFPLGFHLSDDEKSLRKDILLLINTIASTVSRLDSYIVKHNLQFDGMGIPIQAYLQIIGDFINRGYYKEQEVQYEITKRGKINWNRTIKMQKPIVQGKNVFYLDFATKKSSIKENEIITQLHEYCVYESFKKIGWLFTMTMPSKPRIKYNYRLFKSIIIEKLMNTNNDKNKILFRNMLAIIEEEYDSEAPLNYRFGTYRFEYVWEALIDRVYGIEEKSTYFPKTIWRIEGKDFNNANLEPDSIMICGNKIYVLDAKYYKYGATKKPWDLPESTSINKQITYGEYIAENPLFDDLHGKGRKVFNAFLMPYDSNSSLWKTDSNIWSIGDAVSDWKTGGKEYEHIQGILIDIKYLMQAAKIKNEKDIIDLEKCIDE